MDIRVDLGKAEKYPCELLLLFSFDAPKDWEGPIGAVDSAWKGFLSNLMKQGDFKGELHQCQLLYTQGALPAQRVLLTGLGKKGEFDVEKWRTASAKAGRAIRDSGIKRFVFPITKWGDFSEKQLAEAFVTGLLLGIYQFNELKTLDRDKIKEIEEGVLLGETPEETDLLSRGLNTGKVISASVCMARDLVNGPSNKVTPTVLAEKAEKISVEHGMEFQVLEAAQAEAMGWSKGDRAGYAVRQK